METFEQMVETLKSGAAAWNLWLAGKRALDSYFRPNLSDANLRGANLRGANLSGVNLSGVNLRDANLRDSNLIGANMSGADLRDSNLIGANMSGADLRDSNLRGANLSGVKADFFMKVLQQPFEVAGLRDAVILGKINGSTYTGDCKCFVGTVRELAEINGHEVKLKEEASSPIELFFLGISEGDTPETNQVSAIVLSWIDEFQALIAAARA